MSALKPHHLFTIQSQLVSAATQRHRARLIGGLNEGPPLERSKTLERLMTLQNLPIHHSKTL